MYEPMVLEIPTSSNKEYIKSIAKFTYINLFMKTLLITENGENKI